MALRLGMTYRQLTESIGPDELVYWAAFLDMHTDDSWHQTATVASAITSTGWGKFLPPSAFLPQRRTVAAPAQTFGEMEAAFNMF